MEKCDNCGKEVETVLVISKITPHLSNFIGKMYCLRSCISMAIIKMVKKEKMRGIQIEYECEIYPKAPAKSSET